MQGIGFYGQEFFIIKSDHDLIAESIKRILMTNPGERPGQPFFGVGLKERLFEQLDETLISDLKETISDQIATYEPRVDLLDLNVDPKYDENLIEIAIGFKIKGEQLEDERFVNLTFTLE